MRPRRDPVTVDGNRVAFRVATHPVRLIGSSLLFGTTLFLSVAALRVRGADNGSALLELLILVWTGERLVRDVLGFSRVVVFDNDAKTVRRRGPLGDGRPLPFAEVAAIARVSGGEQPGASVLYKVTRRGDRFGTGWALTAPLPPDGEAARRLEETVLPALRAAVAAATQSDAPAWPPRRYRERDGVWSRVAVPSFAVAAVVLIGVKLASPFVSWRFLGVLAALYGVFMLLQTSRVRLDGRARMMHFRPGPLRGETAIPFDEFRGVEEIHRRSVLEPIRLGIRFPDGFCPVCVTYSGRVAAAVAAETEAIVRHADPSNPVTVPSPVTTTP